MNALFVSNPPSSYSPPFHRPRTYQKEARRVSFVGFRSPRCTMDLSIGGGGYNYENAPKFSRMNVWDPYKRLGVTRDASEEEIRGARNFLLEQYAGHEASMESIEAAYEKILMKSFRERKKSKINLKSRLKKKVEESPSWVQTLLSYFEIPPADVALRRLFLFAFMGGWSIINSAETGPAFQVALSLLSCIYFLNDKMKNVVRASLTGFGALVVGWIVGSILVPVIPTAILPPTWTLELLTSLVSYVFLFLACTFLK
ncbi:Protein CHAPERONE-LIKE PROTEIN OF POR1, chloroplastic [Ananas comosus]|uniref:Protein CHAPERONE-LIKE PROTEIN OF POR1, chloroplastic n=1 Tax=Ananas comosus TaxID=4615 RepID=A0A199W9X4_ANACO|nr:Protein CHAPERONE-LIKE PROTEIN OF POR1, chloroplastic [Ananas comosus]